METDYEQKWLRPEFYIREKNIETELKKTSVKNVFKMRNMIHNAYYNKEINQSWSKSTNANTNPYNDTETGEIDSDKFMSQFFHFFTQKLNLKTVGYVERMETNIELQLRKEKEEEKMKQQQEALIKSGHKNRSSLKISSLSAPTPKRLSFLAPKDVLYSLKKQSNADILDKPMKLYEIFPSDIIVVDKSTTRYFKWVASQLQNIKDMNIIDCNVSLFNLMFIILIDRRDYLAKDLSTRKWNTCVQSQRTVLGQSLSYGEV